jgi:DNA-binding transcriptional LysR family regulator
LRRQAQDTIGELERSPRGELVIAANEATCIHVLPKVFSEFKRQFPNVQLLVERSYGSRIVEALLENVADFGIAQLPIAERRIQTVKIHSDEVKVIVPPGHPLANQRSVTALELVDYPLLMPKYGTMRARLNEWLELVEDSLQVSMELDSTEMTKRFVMAGLGISFLAVSHFPEELASGRLKALSLAPEPMLRQIGLVYRKDKALSKAALGFIQVVLAHAGAGRANAG